MLTRLQTTAYRLPSALFAMLACLLLTTFVNAQTETTGAFAGRVINSRTNEGISGITVRFVNQDTQVPSATRTDPQGNFTKYQLQPGTYQITVEAVGFKPYSKVQRVSITETRTVIPVPIMLEPEIVAVAPAPVPEPTAVPGGGTPPVVVTPDAEKAKQPEAEMVKEEEKSEEESEGEDIEAEINTKDGRRSGSYPENAVSTLPLGATTLVRTFDELALLLPGVALPPQTQGNVAGPGVGAGVGSAGQFAVNGLRSRANNFTVDGSDNNDEDIGVRRQGFFTLVPQPIESIKEYQVISLLAPAQYGRNIGAQVNAVSRSGGNLTHGSIFGLFNSSQLNASDFFDTTGAINRTFNLTAGGRPVLVTSDLGTTFSPISASFGAGSKDSFTLGQGGLAFGGPLVPETAQRPGRSLFYFVSAEGQLLNASKEVNFAVPTIAQRGFGGTGATGISENPFTGDPAFAFPTAFDADAIFSFFPFPNNPTGVYGENTFTQVLPASAQGKVVSGKVDGNFRMNDRQQQFTARYNFTQDWRDIPVTGGAIFSRLRPRVRTQNFSTFLNSEISGPNSSRPIFNQLRASYGRTRLIFDEGRDTEFLRPSSFAEDILDEEGNVRFPAFRPEDQAFLLNTRFLSNFTLPGTPFCPNSTPSCVTFVDLGNADTLLGPVGQINIAGFSPVGVDVFNFPQKRVNNTYQLADTMTVRFGDHNVAFGADLRRTELNSDLPRNSRPLITFTGAPNIVFNSATGQFELAGLTPAIDLAAASAASGFFQTLALGDSNINLRYYQYNFFGQDEWRIRPNLSLSYGLRYEYNTPPSETSRRIEDTFDSPALNLVPGIKDFIAGRTKIFDPDRFNFEPRVGIAYSPQWFGPERTTVLRAGFGVFHDQILGAVVSQSRNVFPNFLTVNFGGGLFPELFGFNLLNPAFLGQPGTLNRVSPTDLQDTVDFVNLLSGGFFGETPVSGFGITLPARKLQMPEAYHYSFTLEQQLNRNMVVSAAYIGTQGRHLLRATTPNLGPNSILVLTTLQTGEVDNPDAPPIPLFFGFPVQPGTRFQNGFVVPGSGRPNTGVGAVNIFETSANSRYDALQLQLRGRFSGLRFQGSYTFSKAEDDASDVFDLAGASSLPQNSITRAGERAPSNFDVRHRVSYNLVYSFPMFRDRSRLFRALAGGLELASTGQFHTGQPFTVNSIADINLDGNLTDRLDNLNGITLTGSDRQPLVFIGNRVDALADIGQDGRLPRNSFRAGKFLIFNVAAIKHFAITETQRITFRAEFLNLTNRANFGIPVRFLEFPSFGQATDTVTPGRRIQFALKYSF